jgi:signal peptide peptidase SppA
MSKQQLEGLWAGSEQSLEMWAKMDTAITEKLMAGNFGDDEDEDEDPYLFEKQGSVGVINIKGPITNRDSWLNRLFNVTSYGAIREALIYAANDPEVETILLDVESNGGAVSGCYDTGNLIKMVGKIKPVVGFGEQAYSAGYWLLSSASKVYASRTSGIGSIGVIATHMEYSKQLKDEGVGVTVFRSGQYKALVNSVEALTDVAKIQLQSQLDAAYQIFVEHVAEARNVPFDYCDKEMCDGKEFFGEQALAAGLVDGILSYDELMTDLLNNSIDTSANSINNPRNNTQGVTMKRTLSKEQLMAAAAEGVQLEASAAPAVVPAEPTTLVEPEAAAEAASVAEAVVDVVEITAEVQIGVVEMLQAQLKDVGAQLLAANVDLSKLNDQVSGMQAAHEGLMAIAQKSVSNMSLALNGTPFSAEGLSAAAVVDHHRVLSEKFTAQFKAGGVAAIDATKEEETSKPAMDPRHMARVNAVIGAHAK